MNWQPSIPEKRKRLNREEKKAQTRKTLLRAAHELFALKGFEGCTIDDIASHAGFTRGAFYAHFKNKIDIMTVLIGEGFDEDIEALASFQAALGNVDELKRAYQQYGDRFSKNPSNLLWSLEFQLAALRHPELRPAYNEQNRKLTAYVAEIIKQVSQSQGLHHPSESSRIAPIFIVLQTALGLQRLLDPETIHPELAGDAFELMMRGLLTPTDKS